MLITVKLSRMPSQFQCCNGKSSLPTTLIFDFGHQLSILLLLSEKHDTVEARTNDFPLSTLDSRCAPLNPWRRARAMPRKFLPFCTKSRCENNAKTLRDIQSRRVTGSAVHGGGSLRFTVVTHVGSFPLSFRLATRASSGHRLLDSIGTHLLDMTT